MNRLILITGLLLIGCVLRSQSDRDSLLIIWNNAELGDSVRAKAFKDHAVAMLNSYPDSVFKLSDTLINFGQSKNYLRAVAEGFNMKGISVYIVGDYNQAVSYFEVRKNYYKELGDLMWTSSINSNLGNAYSEMGYYEQSIEYYKDAIEIQEDFQDESPLKYSLAGIAGTYFSLKEYDKAQEYYMLVHSKISEQDKKDGFYDRTLGHIALVHLEMGNLDSALVYAKNALRLSETLDFTSSIEFNLAVLGDCYIAMGELQTAMSYFQRSIELSEKLNHARGKVENLDRMGKIHLINQSFDKAIEVCSESLEISKANNYLKNQSDACQCLYTAYKNIGNKSKALEKLEELGLINDSLDYQKTSIQLQQMEFQKKILSDSLLNVEKERLIREKHEEEVRQKNRIRNILLVTGLFILLLTAGIYSRLRYIRKTKAEIEREKQRSENLLLNILPAEVAEELKAYGRIKAQGFDKVTILFTDFVSFTEISSQLTAEELVEEIHACFEHFDGVVEKYKIEKVKTIGDAYMAAGGLPMHKIDSVKNTILAALDMQAFIINRKKQRDQQGLHAFEMRAGIHTGPIVAGIVGVKKFQYDIWGDTVNTSSRMESACESGEVNISKETYVLIKDEPDLEFEYRGPIEVKGKGDMEMYYVNKRHL